MIFTTLSTQFGFDSTVTYCDWMEKCQWGTRSFKRVIAAKVGELTVG